MGAVLALIPIQRGQAQNKTNVAFAEVQTILGEHCLDCHAAQDPDGKLVMETFADLMKGGETGPALVAGKSAESLLIKMIEGTYEKDGKKLIMPPGKRKKLETNQIALLRGWIDAGANGPAAGETLVRTLRIPKIAPKTNRAQPVNSLAYSAKTKIIASAHHGEVVLRDAESRTKLRTLAEHRGSVNSVVFAPDGQRVYAAAGENGQFGEIRVWNVADGTRVRLIEGHRDAIYSLALSADGKILASGSYDQKIMLWDAESGKLLRTLSGHNGCVYGLAFREDGKLLASASGDRTVKLWDVATGERRDTLGQSLKEVYSVAFSPDGKQLIAGGVDNRIRLYSVSEKATESTNPLLEAKFAHEGSILKLIWSPDGQTIASAADDRTLKLWDAKPLKERLPLTAQPDWVPALVFVPELTALIAGRMDGSVGYYNTANGQTILPPKPELTRAEPRGFQRGLDTKIKLTGRFLAEINEVKIHTAGLQSQFTISDRTPTQATLLIKTSTNAPRGNCEISLLNLHGESGKLILHMDDLPQFDEAHLSIVPVVPLIPPFSFWGVHEKMGEKERIPFQARAGEQLVFDVVARAFGSKATTRLTLMDMTGRVLASNNGFDPNTDPLLAYTFGTNGTFQIEVAELQLGEGADHFYRLSMGVLPYVTACFPSTVTVGIEQALALVGYNLAPEASVKIKRVEAGESDLPLDATQFRFRKAPVILAVSNPEAVESEPNDTLATATSLTLPGTVSGRLHRMADGPDVDLYRIRARSGQQWVVETVASAKGSPVDTRIEILDAQGQPVPRLLLQAVRNSNITFRPIDSGASDCRLDNWEEMELNNYLYMQGEVMRLFRAPQGPDSAFNFYSANGRRRNYFDTSATAHAVDEPCYIVEPHPPGTKLLSNGLPIFPLSYSNDDRADRKAGTDSQVTFTAPADGDYIVRVTDTRGAKSPRHQYRLVLREPNPDFSISVTGMNPTVPIGSGQSFTVSVDRQDGFDGEVRLEIVGLPPGFTVASPIVIQAGHNSALGTINATTNAASPTVSLASASRFIAMATVNGRNIAMEAGTLGEIKLGAQAKLMLTMEPMGGVGKPLEIVIVPGQSIPAMLKIERHGHEELVTFSVENLPHGVIVDNIGLNGVLIPKDQQERQIFLTAARWVPDTERWCYAIENQAGRQTSRPVLLKIKRVVEQVSK